MTIAVFGNTFRPTILIIIEELFRFFNEKGVKLLLEKELFEYYINNKKSYINHQYIIDQDDFEADLALSIGGDGTFLNTAARIGSKNIPILGINTGRLGFLADVSGDDLGNALKAIIENRISVEDRTLLKIETSDGLSIKYPYVLNEISILKQDSSSMLSIIAYLNGEAIHSYHADGLIISTPTGSTAYSMSVGGPLMVPQAKNIILSPIASHSLTVRPLVVPDDWIIDLEVQTRSGCYQISLDGRTTVLEENIKLRVSKGEYPIRVAKQLNHTFFDSLKSKLMWGLDKRN
jgi:NAD+ kinase